jgi:hypothetical protein
MIFLSISSIRKEKRQESELAYADGRNLPHHKTTPKLSGGTPMKTSSDWQAGLWKYLNPY